MCQWRRQARPTLALTDWPALWSAVAAAARTREWPAARNRRHTLMATKGFRDFLDAWGELREADILRRDDDGRYFIGASKSDG